MITALCIYTAYSVYLFLTIYILGRAGERSAMDVVALKLRVTDTSCMGTGKFTWVLCTALGVFNQHLLPSVLLFEPASKFGKLNIPPQS